MRSPGFRIFEGWDTALLRARNPLGRWAQMPLFSLANAIAVFLCRVV